MNGERHMMEMQMKKNQQIFGRTREAAREALLNGKLTVNKEAIPEKKHNKKDVLERCRG